MGTSLAQLKAEVTKSIQPVIGFLQANWNSTVGKLKRWFLSCCCFGAPVQENNYQI